MRVLVLVIGVILILYVSVINSGTKPETQYNFPYRLGTKLLKILSKYKPKTEDPIREIELFAQKLVKKSGLHTFLNGKSTTNNALIPYKVGLRFPTYEQAKFYFLYSIVTNCESKVDDWSCYYCKLIGNNVQLIDYQVSFYHGTKSYVAINHDRREIVLCYQPTTNLGDLLTDLRFGPAIAEIEKMKIQIHKGFRDTTRVHFFRDAKMISGLLKKRPNYKLVLIGHSLGGALASVALFMIKYYNMFPDTEVEYYGYGSSRVGNKDFVDYINQLNITAVRVVHGFDCFTHIPFAIQGYYHIQNEMWVTDDGNGGNVSARFCRQDVYEDPDCSSSLGFSPLVSFPFVIKSLVDHIMPFNIDPSKCYFERPLDFLWRLIWPLRNYWPPEVYNRFPNFTIDNEVFPELRKFSYTGIKEMYKAASKPETYSDPKYEYNLNKIVP